MSQQIFCFSFNCEGHWKKIVSSNLLKIFCSEKHGRFHQLIKGNKNKRIINEENALKEQKNRELAELIN